MDLNEIKTPMTEEEKKKYRQEKFDLIQKRATELSSHFNSVLILCSKVDNDGETAYWAVGEGNYCARFGHAKMWIDREIYKNKTEGQSED